MSKIKPHMSIRHTLYHISVYFIIFMMVSGCPLGDGGTEFRGTVLDGHDKPIVGANVTMYSDPKNNKSLAPALTRKTKEDGKFRVRRGHAPVKGKMILEVKKEGFESYKKQFEAGGLRSNMIIILKSKEPEEP